MKDSAGTQTVQLIAVNPLPTITSLVPPSATHGGAGFTLTVNGTGYLSSSVVNWNGSPRVTTYVSSAEITAAITAPDIAKAGTFKVTVKNPTPGGGTSAAKTFTVN
ncbi:MAG: IPT/TIG domain-containing protein [Terriglobales bacterium]